jgi:hypothetical protein
VLDCVWIPQNGQALEARDRLCEELQALGSEGRQSGQIPAGAGKARDETGRNRVDGQDGDNDGDLCRGPLGR